MSEMQYRTMTLYTVRFTYTHWQLVISVLGETEAEAIETAEGLAADDWGEPAQYYQEVEIEVSDYWEVKDNE